MKITAAKTQQPDKKETANVFKTETSVFDSANSLKTAESTPAPTTSSFAKILEENRKHNEKDNSATAKSDSSEHDSKASKSETDAKIHRHGGDKKELEERNGKNSGGGSEQRGDDENQAPLIALAALQFQTNSVSEHSAPAARSILHIADLERIIATVRTETFQNEKQVTIALKNSILEGLQIKLTITENGKLKAEFLALNEQIKKQLNQRKKELSEILHNRTALFSEVEITSQNTAEKN